MRYHIRNSVPGRETKHRKAILLLSALMMAFGFGMTVQADSLYRVERPAGEAAAASRNIVIIISDDQNVDSLPVMRKLMAFPEGSWVHFTRAYSSTSNCCPSRSSILTGQYSHNTGVTSNSLGANLDDTNTLPVWLDDAGYRTGLVGKYLNGYPWSKGTDYIPPGWDYFIASTAIKGAGNADKRTQLAVDFINSSTSPFFLYLAYSDPHHPAEPMPRYASAKVFVPPKPQNFNEADVSDKPAWIRQLPLLSQTAITTWNAERVNSQRALLAVDDGVQRIVDALKAKGQLQNTLIIFIGDHGFSWGSHRYIKKNCVYEECNKMPLIVRYPGLAGNRAENHLVSNVDLASTLAEYAGVIPQLLQNGQSLIPLITNTAIDWKDELLLERIGTGNQAYYAIRIRGYKYVEYRNGDKELYDLKSDPYELQNQVKNPAFNTLKANLASRLAVLKVQ